MSDINYKDRSWRIKNPQTKREWEALVMIFANLNVIMFSEEYQPDYHYIGMSERGDYLVLGEHGFRTETVSLYEAIARLTTPKKSERDVKLEELSKTVADAQEQIRKLQEGDK